MVIGAIIGGGIGAVAGGITYVAGNHDNLTVRGAIGAVLGGGVGGLMTGAPPESWLARTVALILAPAQRKRRRRGGTAPATSDTVV